MFKVNKNNQTVDNTSMTNNKNQTILFIINPSSGSSSKTNLKNEITGHCRKYELNPVFFETTGENDQAQISEAINENKPSAAVAVGGDGTVNLVASAIINTEVKLGIIPTGSANGMAYELNIPTNLENAVSILKRNVSRKIDLLKINNKHVAIHLSDLGMNARIIKRFDREKIRGLYGYARQFFKELKSPTSFRCIIQCQGKPRMKYKAVMVVMLNTHVYGTGAVINPMGKMDDGEFEIVIIKPYPWYYFLSMVLAFFTGKIHRLRHVRIISCRHAQIKLRPPQDLQIDGEPTGLIKYLEIDVLPKAIEVVYNDRKQYNRW